MSYCYSSKRAINVTTTGIYKRCSGAKRNTTPESKVMVYLLRKRKPKRGRALHPLEEESKVRVSLLRKRKPKREKALDPLGEESKVRVYLLRKRKPKR
jgi:hypothetical protein